MKGRIGDLVTLDQNSNGSPDHVGIIVAFRSDGVPLVDAHNNDCYHVSWKDSTFLFHTTDLDYELMY